MKQFLTILKFELMGYLKNKTYMITTLVLCAMITIGLNIPTFMSLFDDDKKGDGDVVEVDTTFALLDENNIVSEEILTTVFPNAEFKEVKDTKELKKLVNDEKVDAGFYVKSDLEYDYYVLNNSMTDMNTQVFDQVLTETFRAKQLAQNGLDANLVQTIYAAAPVSSVEVLGTDGVSNFGYTYILTFALYFLIIFYGQMIAVGVATEKSNRAVEILVTSANSNALIFGKVIAGAIAGIAQFALILGDAMITYHFTADSWDHMLDMVFNIPIETLMNFAVFGILGYLLYSFIFGALGALVSKSEDINSSATPITIIFVISFMIAMYGLNDPNGIVMVIASYIPLSSYIAMFVRFAMGGVGMFEVILSLAILLGSTIFVGYIAAKIYRMGTLRYGNPIKFSHAFKMLKQKD